jgi:SAM-dependent methyltransferase
LRQSAGRRYSWQMSQFNKFEDGAPSHQNAIDIFKGHWASNLDAICAGSQAGDALHFTPEPVMSHAAFRLGRNGRFDGMTVLELGPLEGGNTYRLEQLGARVLSIEANAEAYLKCLIVKEIAHMKSRFMFGNFIRYLETTSDRFDMVFAAGVLYHMEDPISVIESIGRVSDKCFVWSATYDAGRPQTPPVTEKRDPRFPNLKLHTIDYGESHGGPKFWGGIAPTSTWMSGADMIDVFRSFGFRHIEPLERPSIETCAITCFSAVK